MPLQSHASRVVTLTAALAAILVFGTLLCIPGCGAHRVALHDRTPCSEMLVYDGAPFAKVVSDLNRCFGSSLVVEPSVGLLSYRGGVKKEYLDQWLDAVEYAYGFVVDRTRPNLILLRLRVPSDQTDQDRCRDRLTLLKVRLDEAVADINRCFGTSISFGDDLSKSRIVSATIYQHDVQDFIAAVDAQFPDLIVIKTDNTHFLIRTR